MIIKLEHVPITDNILTALKYTTEDKATVDRLEYKHLTIILQPPDLNNDLEDAITRMLTLYDYPVIREYPY